MWSINRKWPSVPMRRLLLVLVGALLAAGAHAAAAAEIVITEKALELPALQVPAGVRVDFVNRTQRNVHVEFGVDPRQHEVIQIPLTGPIWAVFHRPGIHPYAVHVHGGGQLITLQGRVEVVANPDHPWESTTCAVVVMGNCIAP